MVKFELIKNTREIKYKNRKEIKEGCTLDQDNQASETIMEFDNEQEALQELETYRTHIDELSSATGLYYDVTEYYVEKNIYDEKGNFIRNEGVCDFSKIRIGLLEIPSYKSLEIFDNYADAEKASYDYDGENDVYISFSVNETDVIKRELADIETEINRMETLKKGQISELQRKIKYEENDIKVLEIHFEKLKKDDIQAHKTEQSEFFIEIQGIEYRNKNEAGEKIISILKENQLEELNIGKYRGFELIGSGQDTIKIKKNWVYVENVSESTPVGVILKLDKWLREISKIVNDFTGVIETEKNKLKGYEEKLLKPFKDKDKLDRLYERKNELDKELHGDKSKLTDRKKSVR